MNQRAHRGPAERQGVFAMAAPSALTTSANSTVNPSAAVG